MPGSRHYTATMAADPALPQEDMQQIAASRPDLLPALASNPALYPALREWLEKQPNAAVRAALSGQKPQAASPPTQQMPSPFAPNPHPAPMPSSFSPVSAKLTPAPAASTRSPLDDLLSEAPKVTPTLSDPFSHIPSVNGPEERGSKGRTVVIVLASLIVLMLVAFGVYWFFLRGGDSDGGGADSSVSSEPSSAESVIQTPEAVASEDPVPTTEPTAVKMPAPVGALNVSEFASPTGNLQCQFTQNAAGQDFVKCTMWQYDFVPDVVCAEVGAPLTYELYAEGPVLKRCNDLDTVDNMPAAEYETSMAQNGFACTLETTSGFTCWSEESGQGFQIRRLWDRTF